MASHPNGAKPLINYILSEEGENVIRNVSRVPIRPGVKPTVAKLDQATRKMRYVPSDMQKTSPNTSRNSGKSSRRSKCMEGKHKKRKTV